MLMSTHAQSSSAVLTVPVATILNWTAFLSTKVNCPVGGTIPCLIGDLRQIRLLAPTGLMTCTRNLYSGLCNGSRGIAREAA